MSGLDWDSVSYRNGMQHFGSDLWTGIGLPSYNEEERKVRVQVSKWIPILYVSGKEVSLDPYVREGYEEIKKWDNDQMEDVVIGREADFSWPENYWEGEIEGYKFRIKRVINLVDTEVIDPDGTTWTSRSGFTGWMEKCSLIPWTEDWYKA